MVTNQSTQEHEIFAVPRDLVSVIIAAYNCEHTIAESIRSVLDQSYVNVEILIGEDGSTDHTADVIDSFSDGRIRLISNHSNEGPGPTRDRLLRHAQGRWAVFMDADDVMATNRIERLVEISLALPDCLLFDDILECHETPSGLVPWRNVHGRKAFERRINGLTQLDLEDLLGGQRLLIKPIVALSSIRKTNTKHPVVRYAEDGLFFWLLVARGVPAFYLPEAMYHYRITPRSASSNPARYGLLVECLRALETEALTPSQQLMVRRRVEQARLQHDLAKSFTLPTSKRLGPALRLCGHFLKSPRKLLAPLGGRIKYEVTRLASRGRRR